MAKAEIENILIKLRPIIYLIWCLLIIFASINIFQMGLDTNTQGSRCDYYLWQEGQIYQWIIDNEPCRFTLEFLVGYIFYFVLYTLFDYVRRLIVGFNPKTVWRICEIGVLFGLMWGYLLWLSANAFNMVNWQVFLTSFLGEILFFAPIFLFAIGFRFLSNRVLLYILIVCVFAFLVLYYCK